MLTNGVVLIHLLVERHRRAHLEMYDSRLGPYARDQDVDQTFGSPFTIGSQAFVRNAGERAIELST
jgi:hypothetical protein